MAAARIVSGLDEIEAHARGVGRGPQTLAVEQFAFPGRDESGAYSVLGGLGGALLFHLFDEKEQP